MNKTEEIIKVAIEGDWMKPFIPKTQRAKDLWITLQSEPKAFKVAVCDPKFWQAIGKTKGWCGDIVCPICFNGIGRDSDEPFMDVWQANALKFHEINLTQSFDDAINYLYELIK